MTTKDLKATMPEEVLINALNKINKRYQGSAGNIAGQALKEYADLVEKMPDSEVDVAIKHAYTIYPPPIDVPAWLETLIRAAQQSRQEWQPLPTGWHISWLGLDDGKYTCQLKRHDDDLDYISDISFVSCREYTMHEAYAKAVNTILKEYSQPEKNHD